MLTDKRQEILDRLSSLAIAALGVPVYENVRRLSDLQSRPCAVLIDGDETANENDKETSGISPRLVTMTPEFYLITSKENSTIIRDSLNAMRVSILYAVLGDATLQALSYNRMGIEYLGCSQLLQDGRRIEAGLALRFAFTYILRYSDLS